MRTVYVVRHGQTDYNQQGRYMGSTDISLNQQGIQQANELAEHVSGLNIEIIYHSPLKRAVETASIIQSKISCNLIVESMFTERSVGIYEGLTKEEIKEKFPELFARNITRAMHEAPPEGETPEAVIQRVHAGLDQILNQTNHSNILIVTHGFVSKAIHHYFHPELSDQDFFEFNIPNGGIEKYLGLT